MEAATSEALLEPDVVEAIEKMARQAGFDDGNWTLEAHLENGRYVKAYAKRGPISREEMRELGRRGTPLSG